MEKKKVSFTLTDEAMKLLKALSEKKGLSMASYLETTIRELAKKEKIKI